MRDVTNLIEQLREVDGETLETILRKVGMEKQMLRQLLLTEPKNEILSILDERNSLELDNLRTVKVDDFKLTN